MTETLAELDVKRTRGPWKACRKGECPCLNLWCDDHPIAKFESGEWGDTYPAIRLTDEPSMARKAEAYIEKMTYGTIDQEVAKANIQFIVALENAYSNGELVSKSEVERNEEGYQREIQRLVRALKDERRRALEEAIAVVKRELSAELGEEIAAEIRDLS